MSGPCLHWTVCFGWTLNPFFRRIGDQKRRRRRDEGGVGRQRLDLKAVTSRLPEKESSRQRQRQQGRQRQRQRQRVWKSNKWNGDQIESPGPGGGERRRKGKWRSRIRFAHNQESGHNFPTETTWWRVWHVYMLASIKVQRKADNDKKLSEDKSTHLKC